VRRSQPRLALALYATLRISFLQVIELVPSK
jgi:hypothetical protein